MHALKSIRLYSVFTRVRVALIGLALFLAPCVIQSVFANESLRTLSVLYFTNTTKNTDSAWLSKGLADMLVSDLDSTGAFTVVEREELQKVLEEQELALSGLVDDRDAPKIGALLGAKLLVYGSFLSQGTELRIDAKAVDSETGKVLCTASTAGSGDQALNLERDLVAQLASGLDAPAPRVSMQTASMQTTSLKAAESYYRGIDSMDAGRYAEAVNFFGLSAREDPSYLKPGKGLEDAYRYLKDFKKQRYRREINTLLSDIASLSSRISSPEFYSFADMARDPQKYGYKDVEEASAVYRAHPSVLNGSTPVEATWFLQYMFRDLASKAVEYFGDTDTAIRCRKEIIFWADAAQKAYPKDPFLPELIYQKALVYWETADWSALKDTCEELMGNYPDSRLIESVEEFYEKALEKL